MTKITAYPLIGGTAMSKHNPNYNFEDDFKQGIRNMHNKQEIIMAKFKDKQATHHKQLNYTSKEGKTTISDNQMIPIKIKSQRRHLVLRELKIRKTLQNKT